MFQRLRWIHPWSGSKRRFLQINSNLHNNHRNRKDLLSVRLRQVKISKILIMLKKSWAMWSFHLRTTLSNNRTHNNNSFKLNEIALMRQVPQIIKSNKINRQLNWAPSPNSAKTEERSQTIGHNKTSKNLSGIILSSSNMRLAAIWELKRTTNKIRIIREVVCLENMIRGGRQLLTISI